MPSRNRTVPVACVSHLCHSSKGCFLALAGAASSIVFDATNTSFVATKVCLSCLSRQRYACRVCREKSILVVFVATNTCLTHLFVKTKMILVAAPANGRFLTPVI